MSRFKSIQEWRNSAKKPKLSNEQNLDEPNKDKQKNSEELCSINLDLIFENSNDSNLTSTNKSPSKQQEITSNASCSTTTTSNDIQRETQNKNANDIVVLEENISEKSIDIQIGENIDIGLLVPNRLHLTSNQRKNAPENIWKPDPLFKFPAIEFSDSKRYFKWEWLNRYKWLCYSKILNGAFCLYCVLFCPEKVGGASKSLGVIPKKFVNVQFTTYKNANENFISHENTNYHRNSFDAQEEFKKE